MGLSTSFLIISDIVLCIKYQKKLKYFYYAKGGIICESKVLTAIAQGKEKDIIVCLKADAVNSASFIVKNQLAPFIQIETLEDYPFLTARYGFIDKCYDQEFLRHQLLPVLIPMQTGETKPQELSVITSMEGLSEDVAPRPDWNCLKDYCITDSEYVAMGEQEDDEDENLKR